MSFRPFPLGSLIHRAIQEAGYVEPTPIQAAAIPKILASQDVIGIAQTGTGKTAAFVLPILAQLVNKPPKGEVTTTRALILAPTRELAVQIEESVRLYSKYLSLRMAAVYGGVGEQPQIRALRNRVELVIATPGRLLDLMEQSHASFSGLEFLVLDEADRMLDMGFLPEIRRLIKQLPKQRQTLLFSATLSQEIEKITREFLHHPNLVEMGRRSNPAETVTQWVYETSPRLKISLLLELLSNPDFNMVLVFTRTKHGADRVADRLRQEHISVATLHANRSQSQRQMALKNFKSGKVRVLVATDIASRGIDVDGISHVINYDFPKHPEDYVHRIGRTGRAQAVGEALSFVTFEDYSALHSLERFIGRGITRKQSKEVDASSTRQTATQSALPTSFTARRFSRKKSFFPKRRK
jgi:ATP-dependent RNA helicase RhlE